MSPEPRRKAKEPLEVVTQVRFTRAQADALRAVVDEYEWRSLGTLIRSIVGTWLVQCDELHGFELEVAIEELRFLEAED